MLLFFTHVYAIHAVGSEVHMHVHSTLGYEAIAGWMR